MKNKSSVMLIASLVFALITAVLAYSWLVGGGQKQSKSEVAVSVIVAKVMIPDGTKIQQDMLTVEQKASSTVNPENLKDKNQIIGKFTRGTVLKGEGFPPERLYSEDSQLLNMRIEKDHRAVAISATQFVGVGDMIHEGDRVDVYAVLPEKLENQVIVRPDIAALILQNIGVLSVRKEVEANKGTATGGSETSSKTADANQQIYAITLSVPTKEVEHLMLAESLGTIKLALRPYQSTDQIQSYGTVWQELILDQQKQMRQLFPKYPIQNDLNKINGPIVAAPEPKAVSNAATPIAAAMVQAPTSSSYSWYTVQYGDTLMKLSKRFYSGNVHRYNDIKLANKLTDNVLHPGQTLKIPRP